MKKNYYSKKSYRSNATRKATTVPTVTDTEKIAKRVVKKALSKEIETKHKDGALTSNTVDWNGEVYYMLNDPSGASIMSQGVGVAQYVGEQIRVSSINIRYSFLQADTTNIIRIVVIQTKGLFVPTTMGDILQTVGNIRAPLTALDLDYDQRFTLLYDSGPKTLYQDKPLIAGSIYIKGKYLRKTMFSDNVGTSEDGGIYIGIVSDSQIVTHPLFLAYWRVNYRDG